MGFGEMLRVGEVARLLGVRRETVRRLADDGLLPVERVGLRRERRFRLEAVRKVYRQRRRK